MGVDQIVCNAGIAAVGTSSELVDWAFRCQGNHLLSLVFPAATAYDILCWII